ncbi:MAG: hypothetical protein IJ111_00535 [Eggerthellaceae bacterium]|nr:hypothetical protein [Eggerthellaceae bacterium]
MAGRIRGVKAKSKRMGRRRNVDVRELEQMIRGLMRADLSAGTEAFREELLARCLEELDAGSCDSGTELDDSALDLLAAAGDAFAPGADDNGRADRPM